MASEKTDALVVRLVPWSETSYIATFLSRDFGLISAVAKGARRPKGPFEAALDLLSHCRIVFLPKSGDSLDLLTEAKLVRRFKSGSKDLIRLYAGYYVAEWVLRTLEPGQALPEVFDLAIATLEGIDGEQAIDGVVLRWEMQMLRILGYAPGLESCVGCGSPREPEPTIPFGIHAGGILCPTCLPGQRGVIRLYRESIDALIQVAKSDWRNPPVVSIPSPYRGEIRRCIQRYLEHIFERPFRMHLFLEPMIHSG